MNKQTLYTIWLLAPISIWAQAENAVPVEIDLSDVVVVEDIPTEAAVEVPEDVVVEVPTEAVVEMSDDIVVEIPAAPVSGATLDVEAPEIEVATEALPSDTEIVLELPGQEAEAPGEATFASEETISVDFPDEDIRTILRNVADLFELNLVIPDALQGRTSIKLRNVSWRQVFDEVLRQAGFTYVEDRNIIRITSLDELNAEPVDTRVFIANYARAEKLQGSIAPLVDGAIGGRVQVDVRSNALVITERPSRMNKIQEIIERLDRATDQVMIESKFIEVTNADVKNLGVNWASLSGYSVSGGPFEREWSRSRGSSDLKTTTNTDNSSLTVPGGFTSENGTDITETLESLAGTSRFDTALFSADEFEVIISALNTQDDIKLVSNPTVVTLNNTQAKISIGERYPIPSYTFNAETGQRQLDEIEYEDIGINLDVTPQVNSAGFINLEIVPEVSSTDRFAIVENTEIPIIESRRTESTIMIKDGFTLAIGGLSEDSITNRDTKVPVLGDLPGIGRIFSSENDEITQRNLIIFITAKTLNPDGTTYRDIIDPRMIDRMKIVPSDLPGYELSQDESDLLDKLDAYRIEAEKNEMMADTRQKIQAIEYRKVQEAKEQENASQNRK